MRRLFLLAGCCLLAAPLAAQDTRTLPATRYLALRDTLALDSAQVVKLRDLERLQSAALSRAVAAFYRAEADVVDASRSDDPVARRTALEKRAKVSIDAELARLGWEKEARAVLAARQLSNAARQSASPAAPWRPLVTPLELTPLPPAAADSGELRVSVTPNYADILVDGEKRGTGRRFMILPVGSHEVTLAAVNCERKSLRVSINKSEVTLLTESLTCTK